MSRKPLFYFGISLWIILFWGVSPAAPFEFSFRGAFIWDYVSYSQLGSRGFFGPYDVDNADPGRGGASSSNGWLGYRITSLKEFKYRCRKFNNDDGHGSSNKD